MSSNPRKPRAFLLALALAVAVLLSRQPARGQAEIRRFTEPILTLDTGGHHATPRALSFADNGRTLISAGRDKVACVWDLTADPPGRLRTIRPAIWSGSRGAINALALSTSDAEGSRILALAGHGVENRGGTIALYHFPGSPAAPTGDLIGYLYVKGAPVEGWTDGHMDTIAALAFHPDGRLLASGSNDGTAKLWDVTARRVVATLDHHGAQVRALGFEPGGRLVTGDSQGLLRVWDLGGLRAEPPVPPRAPAASAVPVGGVPGGSAINALAINPDGRFVVVGREGGWLDRYDLKAPNLAASAFPFWVRPPQGADPGHGSVEALAFGPGNELAVSHLARGIARAGDLPSLACHLEVRDIEGRIFRGFPLRSTDLIQALAFSPDGRRLAYAGGDDQAVVVRDWRNLDAPRIVLRGRGRSVWQVGFAEEGRAVAYSGVHPEAGPADRFEGFRLRDRFPTHFAPADVTGPVRTLDGWSVEPTAPYTLRVVAPAGAAGFDVRLDPAIDRRWFAYSFIPGRAPDHPRPTLAVACGQGVAIYDLATGRRTRYLNGHEGFVYAVAPSPDGRWLATGSVDQTVRLWPLIGCDEPAPLGLTFERQADGSRRVAAVKPGGFGEAAGLIVGDVVALLGIGPQAAQIPGAIDPARVGGMAVDLAKIPSSAAALDALFGRLDATAPNVPIVFVVRRQVPGLAINFGATMTTFAPVGTTRRERPALSLFVGDDREWVFWTPRGEYDTSIVGDERLLGWHLNNATVYRPRATDFVEMARYERSSASRSGVPTIGSTPSSEPVASPRSWPGRRNRPRSCLPVSRRT